MSDSILPTNAERLMSELNRQSHAMDSEACNESLPMPHRIAAARMGQALRAYIGIVLLVDLCRECYNVASQPDEDAPSGGTVH